MTKIKSLLVVFVLLTTAMQSQNFIKVRNGQLVKDGKPYHFLGTNFWYGMNLGASDKPRLIRELNRLDSLGVKNLRIMASSEGNAAAPWRMQPTVQNQPGIYDETLLEGLDYLLAEMKKRDMVAVVCLNNFWPWSGGFAQYISWVNNNEPIPFPPPAANGDWRKYQEYSARFYSDAKAQNLFQAYLKMIVNRTNSITKIPYKKDPVIMAWQLANEPEGVNEIERYRNWIGQTAQFIKSFDKNHLVSIGSEGNTPSPKNGTDFEKDHSSKYIDYCTFHLWVQNWDWYDPLQAKESYPKAIAKATEYINTHIQIAKKLNKPVVLEEFGISRDDNSYDSGSTVMHRNQYYSFIFNTIYQSAKENPQVSGVNFWAWGGEGRPSKPQSIWQTGDDFIGDPPHEYQGWYSVYETDLDTQQIIREAVLLFKNLN